MTPSTSTVSLTGGAAAAAALRPTFAGSLILPGDGGYDEARRVWNGMIDRYPALIARCATTADVQLAVRCARDHHLSLAVRGGGHNAAGFATCDDGMVVDLSGMRRVTVDATRREAVVQGGATWADLDRAAQAHGLATPGGAVSDTGVAGLTLGGGLGHLRRKHGLSCDNVLEAEVVTADGMIIRANEREHPDLYWALRGGGGNFGIVTTFRFALHPVGPDVVLLETFFDVADAPHVLETWTRVMAAAPDEFSSNCFYWSLPPAPSVPEALHGRPVVAVMGMWSGEVDEGLEFIAPFRTLAPPVADLTGVHGYVDVQQMVDPFFPKQVLQYYWRSLNLGTLPPEAIRTLSWWAERRPSPMTLIDLWAMGGAVSRVPADATAFGDRSAPFVLVLNTSWADPAQSADNIAWTRGLAQAMEPFSTGGAYLNFPGSDADVRRAVRPSFGPNYDRLVDVKRVYDPGNVFHRNQNIVP